MLGNAYEWVEDRMHNTYEGAPTDGSSWVEEGVEHGMVPVVRGGTWQKDPDLLRAAHRDGYPNGFRDYNIGFRLARTLSWPP